MKKSFLSKICILLVAITCFTMLGLTGCSLILGSEPEEPPAEEQIVPFEYIVSFVTQSDTVVESQTVKDGQKVTKPSDPVKISSTEDYKFEGWYNGEELWDFDNDVVKGDMTLVARWTVENRYSPDYVIE
ncbi:MAG: hypothetical protein E7348_04915 [Clostridiales bacterium]|nr:hypothetical protein [Clostridiales bacterium]